MRRQWQAAERCSKYQTKPENQNYLDFREICSRLRSQSIISHPAWFYWKQATDFSSYSNDCRGRFSMSPLICENFGGSDELWVVACSDQSTSNCHAVLHHWHSPLNLLLHTWNIWNSGSIKSTVSTQSALSLHSDFCKTQHNKNDEKRILTRQSLQNKIPSNSGISRWVEFFCMG